MVIGSMMGEMFVVKGDVFECRMCCKKCGSFAEARRHAQRCIGR